MTLRPTLSILSVFSNGVTYYFPKEFTINFVPDSVTYIGLEVTRMPTSLGFYNSLIILISNN